MNRKHILEVKNIRKSFRDNKVLDSITFTCESGRTYGFVGYNGCGKTVLFKCICGFLRPDSGEIIIDGKKLGSEIPMLPDAGILIEEPAFLVDRSGYKNLQFLYEIRNVKDKDHIYDIMQMVGLDPKNRKRVKNYSMGMKQRLAIAQAIMENQSILILDEPMNGLDKSGVRDMRKLFLELKEQGKIILLASHNREDIDLLCDVVYELDDGRIT